MMGVRLQALLAPRSGEQLLEVGAGNGLYALEVAHALLPSGGIDMVDDQPRMLDAAVRRARERGLYNITAVFADVRFLPFEDGRFDSAYMIASLGHVTDPDATLIEIARVLVSSGRVVVGELHDDPHMLGPARLRTLAASAGFRLARRETASCGYLAELVSPGGRDVAA